jgi:hypothetical protein
MKKRVISFSIFGNQLKYLAGIEENIYLAHLFYPGWFIYIYYNRSVPTKFLKRLQLKQDVKLIDMSKENMPGMFWRFLPYDDFEVELYIVRDLDSRFTNREAVAVLEWINSSKDLHIMRDFPSHTALIMGGMWGLKRSKHFSMEYEIYRFLRKKNNEFDLFERGSNEEFLGKVIYPMFFFSKMVHASFNKYEFLTKKFIVKRIENSFIGECIDEFNKKIYGEAILDPPLASLRYLLKVKFEFYRFCIFNLVNSLFAHFKVFLKKRV